MLQGSGINLVRNLKLAARNVCDVPANTLYRGQL